mgnify:CR=1 FL=1
MWAVLGVAKPAGNRVALYVPHEVDEVDTLSSAAFAAKSLNV